ncbi:hypothetical protein, partial [Tsukamurella tyrosinosolvens]|uniref:hypothetical protein n=1 Tax=Tsukamurella tyrosinosolvens TaxID=57704 RepID=UPI0015F14B62
MGLAHAELDDRDRQADAEGDVDREDEDGPRRADAEPRQEAVVEQVRVGVAGVEQRLPEQAFADQRPRES